MSALPDRRQGELGGTRRPDGDEPRWRYWLWRADWAWRRVVPLLALALAAYAVYGLSDKVTANQDALTRQVEGRRVALEILCGGIAGVEEAGKKILTGTLPAPAPESQSTASQKRVGALYAQAYARVISERVISQAGTQAKGILRGDGTIDCVALKRAARARPQPAG